MIAALGSLSALSQRSRLAAFRALVEAGPEGLTAGALAAKLGLAPATLSFHLARLEQAGLVHGHREGRWIRYAADFARMQGLVDFLTENCCGGDAAACAEGAPGAARARRAASGGAA